MKKKGRKVLSQSTLSIKKLELEVNKLNENLDSIDSKYDTIFDSLVLTFRDFEDNYCLLYTSPSPRDATLSRMPSSA